MQAPSLDIKDMLDGESSLGLTFATDLFVSEMPPTPDLCVCIYDTPGESPNPDYNYEKPGVQVRIRGNKGSYEEAYNLAQDIRDFLNGKHNEEINGARYIGIWAEGDIFFVAYDENHRPLLTINFNLHRTNA
jgi:hypothetical protein